MSDVIKPTPDLPPPPPSGDIYYSTVDAYNTSLTRSTATALSEGRVDLAATTVGEYALFGGGYDDNKRYSTVDAYECIYSD